MEKKIKIAFLILAVYLLVFGIGFKCGAAYLRMKNKTEAEKVEIPILVAPSSPPPRYFYLVDGSDCQRPMHEIFVRTDENHTVIRMFQNEKLRPLLKSRKIKIYKETGERIF